ncbi:MAG: DNA-directed RNA polymerase subunit omega [Clostridiales bacterium]|jgi:DNA-directed RNA polymerase subunit omega|nr:DNA-directed RNA polymerase subunit omega [Clostridiales bacterium]
MLYPSVSSLLEKINNRYLLVNAIASRSRTIAAEAEEEGAVLEKKPVSLAIEDIAEGRYKVNIRYNQHI